MKTQLSVSLCLALALSACSSEPKKTQASAPTPVKPYQPKNTEKPTLFMARVKGRYGFIDKSGKMVLQPQFAAALEFSEGLAPVQLPTGKWGFIDTEGKLVIPPIYDLALPFSEGLATVRMGENFGCINKTGETVVQPKFAGVSQFNGGLAATIFQQMVQGSKLRGWGFIKPDGIFHIPPTYEAVGSFGEGLAPVKVFAQKWGYMDAEQKVRIQPVYESANQFAEGLASVESSHQNQYRWGFINTEGKYILEPRFTLARTFSEGLVGVQTDNKNWGFIDRAGEFVIKPQFSDVGQFHNGLALVRAGLKERYIDATGKVVWQEP